MRVASVIAVVGYFVVVLIAISQAGLAIGSLAAILGAAVLALLYAAGDHAATADLPVRPGARRRRRA